MAVAKWDVKNHGGNPTTNDSKKYAIFVGRFQPYHQGHISLIMQKINAGIPALIMVRDIDPDAKNPFSTEQTVEMIEKYHAAKGHDVEVIIIPDIESVNFGRGVGYEINEFTPPSGTSSPSPFATAVHWPVHTAVEATEGSPQGSGWLSAMMRS